jgi:hypothetical protein
MSNHYDLQHPSQIKKSDANGKTIPVSDETYWELQRMKQERSQEQNRRVTYDEIIQFLFIRRLMSLVQGE